MKKHVWVMLWATILLPLINIAQPTKPLINSTLEGIVLEEKTKAPLPGAVIHIKGTTHEVAADNEGKFYFKTGQKFPYTLIVSYIGFETVEVIANSPTIEVVLKEGKNQLNEVVVVGYGSQKRSELTGAVSSVPKSILNQPAASFDNLLQGAVPGVAVTQSSGQPGGTATVRVRGGNSLSFGNDPLYVIDGFITYNNNSYANTGASNGTAVNALSTINPSDIESIDILKDASATAIYGSRGANGVVLITTRRGKKGANNVNYGSYVGTQRIARKVALLNGGQWASLVNAINVSEGKPTTFTQAQIDSIGEGNNWQDAALKNATIQNHELSITGGDDKSRYLISGNYFNQAGTVLNTGFKRFSGRVNYERNVSEKFKVAVNVFGSKSDEDKLFGTAFNSLNFGGAYANLILTSPVAAIYNSDGTYNLNSAYFSTPTNNLQDIRATKNKTYLTRVLGNFSAEYKLLKELTLKSTVGVSLLNTKQNYYSPSYTGSPAGTFTGYSVGGYASVGTSNVTNWLNENTLTYDHSFGDNHNLNVLAGYTTQVESFETAVASAQKFSNDLTEFNNLGFAGSAVLPSSGEARGVINSWLGRINYSFLHRYNLTISARADGASKLGINKRWGFFPAVGFSWNVSEEDFFKPLQNKVSNLKVRLTAGRTGNSEVPPYSSLRTLNAVNYYFNNTLVTGIAPVQLANPDLQWETTSQYNAGIDLGLFQNRINITFDAYYKKTSDLLLNQPLPIYTGYTSALVNIGSLENKGIEIGASADVVKARGWVWKTNLIFATNSNKVLEIGEVPYFFPTAPTGQVSPVIVQEGLPVGTFWGYKTDGLLTAEDLAKGAPVLTGVSQQVGDRKYVDINGDGKVTTADKHNLGNAQPKFTLGFSNTVSYRNFDLSFFFQGSYGNKVFNLLRQKLEIPTLSLNASAALADRWSETNPNGALPKATNAPVPQVIDQYIENASYVKLKNLTLGYSFSKGVISKIGAKNLRLYATVQNLFTITKYTGIDPEVNFYDQDNLRQGIDYGAYPTSRTFLAGINVTF
jgi:TonB-linked SusC/RagA family outer membrane protein